MPQFNTTFWLSQVFWLLISFGGLYLGVRFVIFPMFDTIFKKRAEKIERPVEQAEKLVSETQKMQYQAEQKKQELSKRRADRLEAAQQQAAEQMRLASEKQEKELSNRLNRSVQKAEKIEQRLLSDSDFVNCVLKGVK